MQNIHSHDRDLIIKLLGKYFKDGRRQIENFRFITIIRKPSSHLFFCFFISLVGPETEIFALGIKFSTFDCIRNMNQREIEYYHTLFTFYLPCKLFSRPGGTVFISTLNLDPGIFILSKDQHSPICAHVMREYHSIYGSTYLRYIPKTLPENIQHFLIMSVIL